MKKTTFLIAGKHAVTEALRNPKRKVVNLFLNEGSKKVLNKENHNLNLLKNVKLFYKSNKELDRFCAKEQISHQGLIAEIEHLEEISLKDYLNSVEEKNDVTFAVLEEVTDPRNIGSIIRSAVSFNIDGIIVKERSFPSESKLLYKSLLSLGNDLSLTIIPSILNETALLIIDPIFLGSVTSSRTANVTSFFSSTEFK